ncbi:hypothetical protein ABZP36_022273 [Zizania latifolia]
MVPGRPVDPIRLGMDYSVEAPRELSPKPLVPMPSSRPEHACNDDGFREEMLEMGRPRNLPASAQTRSSSSSRRAFSMHR